MNAIGLEPGALAHEVVELFLGEELAPREIPRVKDGIPPEVLRGIAGRHDYGAAILTVAVEGSKVFAQLTGQPKHEISKVIKAIHRQGGREFEAPRL